MFVEHNFFGGIFLKEQHLFEIDMFCKIINVFTVVFDHFNPSLLSKSINIDLNIL